MRTVWKFKVPVNSTSVEVPSGSNRLGCGVQNGELVLWFEVPDTNAHMVCREFLVYGTGWEIPEDSLHETFEYFDTVAVGDFVWHVYESV